MNVVSFITGGILCDSQLIYFLIFFPEQFCPGSHYAVVVNRDIPFLSLHYSTGENKTLKVLKFQSIFDTMSLITTKWQTWSTYNHSESMKQNHMLEDYISYFSLVLIILHAKKVKYQTVENRFMIFYECKDILKSIMPIWAFLFSSRATADYKFTILENIITCKFVIGVRSVHPWLTVFCVFKDSPYITLVEISVQHSLILHFRIHSAGSWRST